MWTLASPVMFLTVGFLSSSLVVVAPAAALQHSHQSSSVQSHVKQNKKINQTKYPYFHTKLCTQTPVFSSQRSKQQATRWSGDYQCHTPLPNHQTRAAFSPQKKLSPSLICFFLLTHSHFKYSACMFVCRTKRKFLKKLHTVLGCLIKKKFCF